MQGQYTARVGKKFRIAFPSAYRQHLGEKVIITFGFEGSLIATSEKNWQEIVQKELNTKSFLQSKARDLRRFFLGGVSNIEFDAQGRFVLAEYLRNYSKIAEDKDAVFVGQDEYIEIWEAETWNKKQQEILGNIGSIADSLEEKKQNG